MLNSLRGMDAPEHSQGVWIMCCMVKNVAYSLAIVWLCNKVYFSLTLCQCSKCILQRSFICVLIFIIDQEFPKNVFGKLANRYFVQPEWLESGNHHRFLNAQQHCWDHFIMQKKACLGTFGIDRLCFLCNKLKTKFAHFVLVYVKLQPFMACRF